MILDFTHNKVIKDTITEGFIARFEASVVPQLEERYAGRILGVQMYEDYVKRGLAYEGYWYYPLTVITSDGYERIFIRWSIINEGDFDGGVPYAFVGYSLDFEICDSVPEEILAKSGEVKYFEGHTVKLSVHTTHPDKTFLSGKYSQSFIDEMARQLTVEISRAMEISGLESSSVELSLVFAPDTYMEHTSENKTYRRLLLSAKGCSPRDFWIKWTRLDGEGAYSVNDEADLSNIRFEIAEDVPQKIREKEYRFLVYGNSDKYRVAMGRKNIVEWREIIKRALKRGELEKAVAEVAEPQPIAEADEAAASEDSVLSDKLKEILAKCAIGASESTVHEPFAATETEQEKEPEQSDEFAEAMRIARMAAGLGDLSVEESEDESPLNSFAEAGTSEGVCEEIDGCESARIPEPLELSLFEFAQTALAQEAAEAASVADDAAIEDFIRFAENDLTDDGEEPEFTEPVIEELVIEELTAEEPTAEEITVDESKTSEPETEQIPGDEFSDDEPIQEEILIDEPVSDEEALEEVTADVQSALEETANDEPEKAACAEVELIMDKLRAEAEALKQREEELERRERELISEREKLLELIKEAETAKAELEELRQKEEKARSREKLLFAEAARMAVEENERKRLEQEQQEAESVRKEELRRKEQEEAIAQNQRAKEIARIENELRPKAEDAAPQSIYADSTAEVNIAENQNYTYTSKIVRLIFRHKVDPGMIAKVHDTINEALEYFHKEHVYIKVRASISEGTVVVLNFVKIPEQEINLLIDIIKILGNSGLGIIKIVME